MFLRKVITVDHKVTGVGISSGAKPALGKPGVVGVLLVDAPRTALDGAFAKELPLLPRLPLLLPPPFPLESLETVPLMLPLACVLLFAAEDRTPVTSDACTVVAKANSSVR